MNALQTLNSLKLVCLSRIIFMAVLSLVSCPHYLKRLVEWLLISIPKTPGWLGFQSNYPSLKLQRTSSVAKSSCSRIRINLGENNSKSNRRLGARYLEGFDTFDQKRSNLSLLTLVQVRNLSKHCTSIRLRWQFPKYGGGLVRLSWDGFWSEF